MRSWRPTLVLFSVSVLLALGTACRTEHQEASDTPQRFAAVRKPAKKSAARTFCDVTYPAKGGDHRRWNPPPDQPVPGVVRRPQQPQGGWTWVNLWASWCGPCIEEMPLLRRWRKSLRDEGVKLELELWSVDRDRQEFEEALTNPAGYPGVLRWLKDPDGLPELLTHLGVSKNSAIPVHALVDPQGALRCVRVGKVSETAYGAVRTIFTGSQ